MSSKTKSLTPLMRQYHEIKEEHEGAILLFRVGDFYETFADDAELVSEELGITLTKRNNYAAAAYWENGTAGVGFADVSTGEFALSEVPAEQLNDLLQSITPAE